MLTANASFYIARPIVFRDPFRAAWSRFSEARDVHVVGIPFFFAFSVALKFKFAFFEGRKTNNAYIPARFGPFIGTLNVSLGNRLRGPSI